MDFILVLPKKVTSHNHSTNTSISTVGLFWYVTYIVNSHNKLPLIVYFKEINLRWKKKWSNVSINNFYIRKHSHTKTQLKLNKRFERYRPEEISCVIQLFLVYKMRSNLIKGVNMLQAKGRMAPNIIRNLKRTYAIKTKLKTRIFKKTQ